MKPMGGRTWKYWPASGPVFLLQEKKFLGKKKIFGQGKIFVRKKKVTLSGTYFFGIRKRFLSVQWRGAQCT